MAEIKLSEILAGILFLVGIILAGIGSELYYAIEYEVFEKINYASVFCVILGMGLLCWSVGKRFASVFSPREEE